MSTLDRRRALFEAIGSQFDETVARAERRVQDELPGYAAIAGGDYRIAVDLQAGINAFLENRPFTDDERAQAGESGRIRAEQGIPLEELLQVYRITVDEVWNAVWDISAQDVLEPQELLELSRDVWHYADEMMEAAAAAYRARELEQALADSERRSAMVHALLLSPRGADSPAVSGSGLSTQRTYVAIRARPADGEDAQALMRELTMPGVADGGKFALYEGDVIGLAANRPTVAAGACIGVGPPGGLADLARSFVVASRVVETASSFGRGGVLEIEDVPLESIAYSEGLLGDALVAAYVDAVDPGTAAGDEILRTVEAYLGNELSSERAAEALVVHPNTVRNRLHRYERLTGASLRDVDVLTKIRWALLRASLR